MAADRAVKEPSRVATIADITLSGLQTIDGVTVAAGDRVLVKHQSSAADNGIYDAASGAWARSADFDGAGEVVGGTEVLVTSGTANSGSRYRVAGSGPITIGSSAILFAPTSDSVRAADFGFGAPGNSPSQNAAALQAAVDQATTVYLPDTGSEIEFDATIIVPPGTVIVGAGADRSRLHASDSTPAFEFMAGNGDDRLSGQKFAEFTLRCEGVGIKLNDPTHGFTDDASSQKFVLRPRLERVRLLGPGAGTSGSRGVDFSKVFHAVIDQCEIARFEIGVRTLGCDFPAIVNRTRIWNCATLVHCESVGYFGSGMLIDGVDLLIPTKTFIKSSDHQLVVRDSYFEVPVNGTAISDYVLDIDHNYMTSFTRNRFEVPALDQNLSPLCPLFLKVGGEGALFVFEGNSDAGTGWGSVSWNSDNSARYQFTAYGRQKIVVRNNAYPIAVPFNSDDDGAVRNERRDLWLLSAGTSGFVSPYPYSGTCRVRDGAFVLPYPGVGNGLTTLVRFKDPDRPITGNVDVYVRAKASVAGLGLAHARYDGASWVNTATVTLSTAYAWYKIYANVAVADLAVEFFNGDDSHAGEAHIQMVTVELA